MTKRDNMRLFHDPEMPGELLPAILARITLARRRAAQFKLAALGTVIVTLGAALIPSIIYTVQEFHASGFYDYLSLMFSDGSVAFSQWRELALSLVESTPSLALLLMLGLSLALFVSLRSAIRSARVVTGSLRIA